MRAAGLAILGLAVSGIAYAQLDEAQLGLDRGRAFVEANCSACHATGPTGQSPLAAAPPFRYLEQKYPVENIAEALAEGIITGHAEMPQFVLEPPQIGDVIAYLKSLQTTPPN
jgi:cytochrome c